MRKLCACLLLSGLLVVGCNKPNSSNTTGRNNAGAGGTAGAAGHTGNTGHTSNYGATGAAPGAPGTEHGTTPPNANLPPAPGNPSTPGHRPGEANTGPGHTGENSPGGAIVPPPSDTGTLGASMTPEQFATRAWQGDAAEVKLAHLAEKNGKGEAVKKFAQRMIQDHSKANEQLDEIAKANKWDMPKDLNQQDQREYDRLAKLKGQEFDQAYIQHMLQDHEHDIQMFEKEARNGKDAQLQGWAKKTLPVLQQHLQMAQQAAKDLGIPASSKP